MKVKNVHERELSVTPAAVGALLDEPRRMWPERWPRLRDDRIGFLSHEPLTREPGQRLGFRITGPSGLSGWHGWDVEARDGHALLRHTVEADCRGWMRVAWPLVVRPIHDALHEDVLDRAEQVTGGRPQAAPWSRWVRLLRWAIARRRPS